MTTKYDEAEALKLLAEAAEKVAPDKEGHLSAARELIEALVGLNNKFGFSFERGKDNLVHMREPGPRSSGNPDAVVLYSSDTGKWSFYRGGEPKPLLLTYDRLTSTFIGPEVKAEDGSKKRRSALGTVISALLGKSSMALYE